MQVKSIGAFAILSTFIKQPLRPLFCLFLSGSFTQVLLYLLSDTNMAISKAVFQELYNCSNFHLPLPLDITSEE